MCFPIRDHAEGGQIAITVQQQGQLHPALCAAKFHSGTERETQVDHGGIQADRFIRESELACADRLSRDKLMEPTLHLREELSRPVRIGLRQGRTEETSHARMDQFPSPPFSFSLISRKA